jgi:hypothetical protein
MDSNPIAKIWIDDTGKLCVQPESVKFEHIYRSAMGVQWNPSESYLYPPIIGSWAPNEWFCQILAAVKNEYGYKLYINPKTKWVNVDETIRLSIESENSKPRINVSFTFFSPEKGGRRSPIFLNSYRPHLRVIGDTEYIGVQFNENPNKGIAPDVKFDTEVTLLYFPDVSYKKLRHETGFEILEGAKVIGKGKVINQESLPKINEDLYYCPAVEKEIDVGHCWEYCFVDMGGPTDTAIELKKWIGQSSKFAGIEDFHKVCDKCPHCQWSR